MGVTGFTFILLPLCLLWAATPGRLLQLMLVASVFEAAAAITLGSFGVQPALMPGLAFLAYIALQLLLGAEFAARAQAWQLTRPFVFVTFWAVASSWLMPRVFEDRAWVWPQKAAPPMLAALAPSDSNLNQDFYLIINCLLLVAAAMYLSRARVDLGSLMRAYFLSGFLAAGIAFWQFANKLGGVPYPSDLLYSNPGWAILTDQRIGALPRINGSFSEPAALASYMASIVCSTGWLLLQGHRGTLIRALFLVGLATIVVSTSTTGFAVLAIVAVGLPGFALATGATRMLGAVLKVGVPLILLLALAGFGASTFIENFDKNASEVLGATLNKQQSDSYNDRTGADLDSLNAAVDTYGLGVGWGSNRSSSLLPGLVAQLGLPGMAGLAWFGLGLAAGIKRARRRRPGQELLLVIDGCCGALVGFLLAALLSAPTITSAGFFLLLALLIGALLHAERSPRTADAAAKPAIAAAGGCGPTFISLRFLPPHVRHLNSQQSPVAVAATVSICYTNWIRTCFFFLFASRLARLASMRRGGGVSARVSQAVAIRNGFQMPLTACVAAPTTVWRVRGAR